MDTHRCEGGPDVEHLDVEDTLEVPFPALAMKFHKQHLHASHVVLGLPKASKEPVVHRHFPSQC